MNSYKSLKILVTSGGTKVPIDSVRHIDNMSGGTAGAKIAAAFINKFEENNDRNSRLLFFHRKSSKNPFTKFFEPITFESDTFETYDDYSKGLISHIESFKPDVVISAAAVSDYGVEKASGKISSDGSITLTLNPLPKVLPLIKKAKPDVKLVGFKLLVDANLHDFTKAAKKQMEEAGSDIVAANDLTNIRAGLRRYYMYVGDTVVTVTGNNVYKDFVNVVYSLFEKS